MVVLATNRPGEGAAVPELTPALLVAHKRLRLLDCATPQVCCRCSHRFWWSADCAWCVPAGMAPHSCAFCAGCANPLAVHVSPRAVPGWLPASSSSMRGAVG